VLAAYVATAVAPLRRESLDTYPLKFPDSFDWLTNGLRYAGIPVECTWRSILNPLVYAALFDLHLDDAIPFLGAVYLCATTAMLLTIGRRAAGTAAIFCAALYVSNHAVLANAFTISSDILSIGLGSLGLLAFHAAIEEERSALLYVAAAGLSLGFLAQASAQFLLPACVLTATYDPAAPSGFSWRRWGRLVRSPHTWGAVALAALCPLALSILRYALVGVVRPRSGVAHEELIAFGVRNVPYYAWSTLASLSLPVAALAALGVVSGLRAADRRLTLALVAAAGTNFAFFTFAYGWRDNRFVLYWTLPCTLLAGAALARLPWRMGAVMLAVALVYGNLALTADVTPFDPAIVWSPWRASAMDYYSAAIHAAAGPIRPYSVALHRWARRRRATFSDPSADDIYYSRERELIGRLASSYTRSEQTLFFHPGADTSPGEIYILKNQLALYARRRVSVLAHDGEAPPADAVVLVRSADVSSLETRWATAGRIAILERRPRYALIRLTAGSPAPG